MVEMNTNMHQVFFKRATVFDIARFCRENGYCLEIISNQLFTLTKERSR